MAQKAEENKQNRKLPIAIALIFASVAIITGLVFAFFSDYITGNGSITSGTLNINSANGWEYRQNSGTYSNTAISNFNPGDVANVKISATNSGNKSAWIRTKLDFGTLDPGIASYIKICAGELTYAQCDGTTNPYLTLTGGVFTSDGTDVINGTGTGAETETGGVATYAPVYTIKFDSSAPNSAQGKSISFTALIQAIQYRNNPTPNWGGTIEQII